MDIDKDFKDGYFSTRFGRIHYKMREGYGGGIVFLHGFAGSVRTWTRLLRYVNSGSSIYLVDLLGHGASDVPDVEYSFDLHYDAISGLIESLHLDGCCVFGHSYGGWLAAEYAFQNKIDGLILEDAAGLKEFYEEREAMRPEYKEQMVHRALELNSHERVVRSMINADNRDYLLTGSTLGSIESSTLIMWGGQDDTVATKYAYEFKKLIPKSRLEIFPDERHTPHYTNPEAVARVLSDFLAGLG